jgi:acyl-CoA synthetase (AMP-forming)/AMP-acid ligase II
VVVIGVKHKTDGQFPRAYVRVKDGKYVTEEELIEFVRGLDLI